MIYILYELNYNINIYNIFIYNDDDVYVLYMKN